MLNVFKKTAESNREYAQKRQREAAARLLAQAAGGESPITITEAANRLSGTGGMLETMNGYKSKQSLDIGIRTHAADILRDIGIDVMSFVKKRSGKFSK